MKQRRSEATLPSPQSVPQSRPIWKQHGLRPFLVVRLGVGRKFVPYADVQPDIGGNVDLILGLCPASNAATFDGWRKPSKGPTRRAYHGTPSREASEHKPRYGTPEKTFLAKHRMRSDDTARRGLGRKTKPADKLDSGSRGNVELSDIRHPHWRERLEQHSEAGYKFLRRWAETTRRNPYWRVKEAPARERKAKKLPRFTRSVLTAEGQFKRDLDLALDYVGARAERLHQEENTDLTKIEQDTSGWGHHVGAYRGDRLHRVRRLRERAEDAIHARLDFWKASGAVRTDRGYVWPRALVALAAREIGGWAPRDLEAFDSRLNSKAKWLGHEIYFLLREDYAPKSTERKKSVKIRILQAARVAH